MKSGAHGLAFSPAEIPSLIAEREQLRSENRQLRERLESLQNQLDWLKRQVFGQKSERRLAEVPPEQMSLGEAFGAPEAPQTPVPAQEIPAHTRRPAKPKPTENENEEKLFFDDSVPVETIAVVDPDTTELAPDEYEVIGEKVSYRLAQRPGSYVILKYVRQLIKRRDDQSLHCPPVPKGVFDHSRADVSLIAGLVVDKFAYHQPLYRQHQRLRDSGIAVSRPWLTGLVHSAAALLEPIFDAQLAGIRQSRVKAMDDQFVGNELGQLQLAPQGRVSGRDEQTRSRPAPKARAR